MKNNEIGRSMIEMLGVLAVIGILSVSGISGYTYVLNKYYANTILNEALMNHVQVFTAFNKQNGKWKEIQNTIYPMQYRYDKNGNDYIKIQNIPLNVCKQLLNLQTNTLYIYTTDFEKMNECSKTNEIIIGFNSETILPNPDTANSGYCENGNVYLSYQEDPCTTVQEMTGDCKKNSDCEKGQYCKLSGEWTGSEAIITIGVCTSLDEGNIISYNNKTFLAKQNYLTWWSAENWCKAHKKVMVSREDLGCTLETDCPETNDLGTGYYWINYNNDSPFGVLARFSPQEISAYNRSGGMYVLCQ